MNITQQDQAQLCQSAKELARLEALRGAPVASLHKKLANDPTLLKGFTNSYQDCCTGDTVIPAKYRELIFLAITAAGNFNFACKAHCERAIANGASIEELGEVMKIVLNVFGTSAVLPVVDAIFDEIVVPE